jgi:hypothetical protein
MIGRGVVKLTIAFWIFAVLRADVSIAQPDLGRHLHNARSPLLGKMKETDLPASSCSHHVADSSVSRPLTFYHIVASLDRCRMSDQQTICQSGHRSIGGHRVAFLVRTVRLCKPRAAGIEIQRQPLVLPAIAERSLAGPHAGMSGARSGHPQILAHRDEQRPFLC